MLKNSFHKYYHPKNNFFFVHIVADAILILTVGSLALYIFSLMAYPAKYPIANNSITIPKNNPAAIISAKPASEDAAKKKILNELRLSAICRYTLAEGDQLGVGPLPPKIGETTKYWILLSPSTNYFDVNDVTVTADLAQNVTFTGRTSAVSESGIEYDEVKRQISWKISKLSNKPNELMPPGSAFEIAFTPTEDQAGHAAELITGIKISGIDSPTKTAVKSINADLTTHIIEDISGGIVQPYK